MPFEFGHGSLCELEIEPTLDDAAQDGEFALDGHYGSSCNQRIPQQYLLTSQPEGETPNSDRPASGKTRKWGPRRSFGKRPQRTYTKGCRRSATPPYLICTRHQEQIGRKNAPLLAFSLRSEIDYDIALNEVYAEYSPLNLPWDDVDSKPEDQWIAEFIRAVNKPYVGPEFPNRYEQFWTRQQTVFNGRFFDRAFDEEDLNVRMRLLYNAAYVFHVGGQLPYPRGGDNDGYPPADTTTIFSERLNEIIRIMETDKRVCLDVIEGRGVLALGENPDKYEKRKLTNKNSNSNKPKPQKFEEEMQEMMKVGEETSVDDDECEDDSWDDNVAVGPSHVLLERVQTPLTREDERDTIQPCPRKQKRGPQPSIPQAADMRQAKRQKRSVGRLRKA